MKWNLPSASFMGFVAFCIIFFCLAFFAGCASEPIIKVDPMVNCSDGLDASLLADACDAAKTLPDGATYEDGLNAKRNADSSLEICRAKVAKLQQALATCKTMVEKHNQAIQALTKQ